jgi:hypothetical protein
MHINDDTIFINKQADIHSFFSLKKKRRKGGGY